MTNHVHLLLTPADPAGPARLMCALGRRYVRYFNRRFRRTGTLWEGRYRSALVASSDYCFACSRYIELNPLRAGLVDDPAEYPWSSFHHSACGGEDPVVTPHPQYAALGAERDARCAAYRALSDAELAASEVAAIRTAPFARWELPTSSYQMAVAAVLGAPVAAGMRPPAVDPRHEVGGIGGSRPDARPSFATTARVD